MINIKSDLQIGVKTKVLAKTDYQEQSRTTGFIYITGSPRKQTTETVYHSGIGLPFSKINSTLKTLDEPHIRKSRLSLLVFSFSSHHARSQPTTTSGGSNKREVTENKQQKKMLQRRREKRKIRGYSTELVSASGEKEGIYMTIQVIKGGLGSVLPSRTLSFKCKVRQLCALPSFLASISPVQDFGYLSGLQIADAVLFWTKIAFIFLRHITKSDLPSNLFVSSFGTNMLYRGK
ncbi:hypothetical protein M9H77_12644 [Catharanthus roseus]|uniref:Uncharacterized protein n=1 Tax=Catharanthus roseus TaxID=4058 RepID=A0ACC0BI06_CATRO|nr:hypothetical protein M9H77_12644 [Catharanthus roseus]